MLDHVGFTAGDYARSKAFYLQTLDPVGITLVLEIAEAAAGFGEGDRPYFWLEKHGQPTQGRLHIAFTANSREKVDAFHTAGLAAGGTDNGAPGVRAHYHPDYYGAYILDPDGHNIEAVCHRPE
jgi:catechol 2,3-dioxygenase-like lactoylglutathione lyase family enzyme